MDQHNTNGKTKTERKEMGKEPEPALVPEAVLPAQAKQRYPQKKRWREPETSYVFHRHEHAHRHAVVSREELLSADEQLKWAEIAERLSKANKNNSEARKNDRSVAWENCKVCIAIIGSLGIVVVVGKFLAGHV